MRTLSALLFVSLLGCTVQNNTTPTDGGAKDGSTASEPVKLSCVEVLTCSTSCMDKACDDACTAKGTPDAQQKIKALLDCGANNCAEAGSLGACLESSCSAEINACADDVAGKKGMSPPTGDVQAALVGTWQSVSGAMPGTSHKYTFDSKGLFVRVYKYEEPNCPDAVIQSKTVIDDGKWAVQGDVLTTAPEVSTQTTIVCQGGTSSKMFVGFNRSFKFKLDGNMLTLAETDSDSVITYMKQ